MADQIFHWYLEQIVGDGTEQGPTFYADQDYTPAALRVMVKTKPDSGDMTFDIKDDGVTILSRTARLVKGTASDPDAEEFPINPPTIAEGSLITLDVIASGAKGISVQLELDAP